MEIPLESIGILRIHREQRRTVEDDQIVYYYYCYLGARQRGSMKHFALAPCGISKSIGEGRLNPESEEAYHKFCQELFGEERCGLIKMTDGARAYLCRCARCQKWFEEHHAVNHSRKPRGEFSRPVDAVVANMVTLETRPSMAGTMTLDGEWGHVKKALPDNLSAKTQRGIERCDVLVRAEQFRRMHSNEDLWPAFCKIAQQWRHEREKALAVGTVAAKGVAPNGFARRSAQRRQEAIKNSGADEEAAEGPPPLSLGEKAALQASGEEVPVKDNEKEALKAQGADKSSAGADADGFVVCNSFLWKHLEGVHCIPPDILDAFHSGLAQVYCESSADDLFSQQWLCDCNDLWSDFATAVHSKPVPDDASPMLPSVLEEFRQTLFSIQRFALQNSAEFGNLGKTDETALQELALGELSLVLHKCGGANNNCLIYSLAQGLVYQGLFDFGSRPKYAKMYERSSFQCHTSTHEKQMGGNAQLHICSITCMGRRS